MRSAKINTIALFKRMFEVRVQNEAPNLTSLGEHILRLIVSHLDFASVLKLRLVSKLLKKYANERVTTIKYGGLPCFSNPQEIERACRVWPGIKTIYYVPEYYEEDAMESLLHSTWIGIEEFHCGSYIGCRGAAGLSELSQRWTRLRELRFSFDSIDPEGLVYLATGAYPALEKLILSSCGLGSRAGAPLATFAARCPNLKELDLERNELVGEDLKPFFNVELNMLEIVKLKENLVNGNLGAAQWPRLCFLDLKGNCLDEEAIIGICKGEWPLLENLDLSLSEIGVAGAEALRDAAAPGPTTQPRWPCLQHLDLTQSGCDGEILQKLFQSKWGALKFLNLRQNYEMGLEGAKALAAAAPRLPVLTTLDVRDTDMNAQAIEALLSICWSTLERLETGDHNVKTLSAIAAGAQQNHLPTLKSMSFFCDKWTPKHFRSLLECSWPGVEKICFGGCNFTWKKMAAIAEAAPRLPNIQLLVFSHDYEEDRRKRYGGEKGLMLFFCAPWSFTLKKVAFNLLIEVSPQFKHSLAAHGWRILPQDKDHYTRVERIDLS